MLTLSTYEPRTQDELKAMIGEADEVTLEKTSDMGNVGLEETEDL